ncbi:MAG TPA: hypothetical protein VGX28_10920 [Frankiaceae bacterium]|jgi:hypothetical protein|nr:hypothetical protein [Frankiaceae bacterium]
MTRRHAAAMAASILLTLATGSAHADTGVGAGATPANRCGGSHCWAGVNTVNAYPLPRSGAVLVVWNCQATSTPDATLTSITECSFGDYDAPAVTVPGGYAATASWAIVPTPFDVEACVGGFGVFAENAVGDHVVNAAACKRIVAADLPL